MKYLTKSIMKMPKRKKISHKGDFGRVMIIGGSTDFVGAPALAALAAKSVLRSGADIATLVAPAKVAWTANKYSLDIITMKHKGDYFTTKHTSKVLKQAKMFDVIVIGNGLGRRKTTLSFVKSITKKFTKMRKPMVIDADAIKAIRLQDVDNAIITPHKTEFKILLKNSRLNENNFRKKLKNNIILLKGAIDKVISRNKIVYNKTGNAVMTKGGTGDVLAGLCAGFLAQTKNLFKSASMGAYLTGSIGDYLLKKRGRTFVASDMVENLHKVFI